MRYLDERLGVGSLLAAFTGGIIYLIDSEKPIEAFMVSLLGTILSFLNTMRLDMIKSNAQQEKLQKTTEELLSLNHDIAFSARTGQPRIRIINDPRKPVDWENFVGSLDAFNAPWILAHDDLSLYPAFKRFMSQPGFRLRVLMFGGDDDLSRADFMQRKERIESLKNKLKGDGVSLDGKIHVAIVPDAKAPTTTFFLSQRETNKTSLIYLYPFLAGDAPLVSLEINDTVSLSALTKQFEESWRVAALEKG